jgi:hypothetical protein
VLTTYTEHIQTRLEIRHTNFKVKVTSLCLIKHHDMKYCGSADIAPRIL